MFKSFLPLLCTYKVESTFNYRLMIQTVDRQLFLDLIARSLKEKKKKNTGYSETWTGASLRLILHVKCGVGRRKQAVRLYKQSECFTARPNSKAGAVSKRAMRANEERKHDEFLQKLAVRDCFLRCDEWTTTTRTSSYSLRSTR